MSDPFVAEIRLYGFNFAPRGWAACDGQILPISQNTALFSLLGTMYGGNGQSTFALPNFQGRAPMQWGQGPGLSDRFQGDSGGASSVTLLSSEMPQHTHAMAVPAGAAARADRANASGNYLGVPADAVYSASAASTVMNGGAVSAMGGGLPHNNMQPFLAVNFCIALQGIYPPRQ